MAGIKENIVAYWGMNEDLNDELGNNNGTLHVNASAYYPFNGNANDESDNSNDGTVSGATLTTDRFGNADKAYSFDGTNDKITLVDSNTLISDLQAWTISAWFRATSSPSSNTNAARIITLYRSSNSTGISMMAGQNKISLMYNSATNSQTTIEGPTYSLDTDYQATITYDGTNYKIYLNGDLEKTQEGTAYTSLGTQDATIGSYVSSSIFDGKIDEVLILNKALGDNEVASLYELTSRHDLNDIYVDGKVEEGAELWGGGAGTDKATLGTYIELDSNEDVTSNNHSLSFWYKTESSYFQMLFQQSIGSSSSNIELSPSGNTLSVESRTNNYWDKVFSTGIDVDDGEWHLYTLVFSSTDSKLYVDGSLADTETENDDSADFRYRYIGGYGNTTYTYGQNPTGAFDEVAIFDTALSSDEVARIYNSGVGSKYPIDFEVNIGIDGKGVVDKDPDKDYYLYQEEVELTPNPQLGSHFVEWLGDITSETSIQTITIDQEYTLTSEFIEYPTVKSKSIYLNSLPVTTARLTATTTSDTSNFIFGMSNVVTSGIEGIGVMEEVSNGTTHTFTDPTGQEVQYQIWGKVPGTSISKIRVRIN
jgi:hypothetical protein